MSSDKTSNMPVHNIGGVGQRRWLGEGGDGIDRLMLKYLTFRMFVSVLLPTSYHILMKVVDWNLDRLLLSG